MRKLASDFSILRYDTYLRLVEENDAKFILDLRTNENRNKYVSPVPVNLGNQVEWIRKYKEREKEGLEYYFLVADKSKTAFGTTRLYNFRKNIFETGSWIFREDSPDGLAIKGDIIGREIAFELLGFDICQFNVRKKNEKVLRYHLAYKPSILYEDELNVYFELEKNKFYEHKNKLLKILGYGI